MCKNKVQFQAGYSLVKLFKNYGAEALSKWRCAGPLGFVVLTAVLAAIAS